ncbi:carbon-nitrogen hydrolase family protein [Chelativorans xinjiangense]|uniref:carbon-nitrogen hydrolase family protein n=1 Tax=Chelativorans xinjiangense TaxID=2681485 RepID=UPI00135CC09D|nr:carbon-nitrogen hydrolase family protein [Chelativorans xinjiangense]
MRIAAFQMKAVAADQAANLARIEKAAREASAGGAELLVAPELALPGYGSGDDMRNLAEPPGGEVVAKLTLISLEVRIAILAGFAEAAEGSTYNSAVFADGRKEPVIYRKSHLYGDYERDLFAAEPPSACIVEHGGLRIGILICYDVEFPENVRRLAQAGAELVAVPTALPASDHAELIARKMIPVRAFENQVFVAYANHCGADNLFSYAGLSAIAAPDGNLLAEADETSETLLFADIRPQDFAASAAANPYLRDLRL